MPAGYVLTSPVLCKASVCTLLLTCQGRAEGPLRALSLEKRAGSGWDMLPAPIPHRLRYLAKLQWSLSAPSWHPRVQEKGWTNVHNGLSHFLCSLLQEDDVYQQTPDLNLQ